MNCKKEFLKITKNEDIKCALLSIGDYSDSVSFKLKKNYTKKEFNSFLKSLDFNYDNGFGGQNLFGTIWFKNNTWAERGEYDGSEWWQIQKLPKIPDKLK